MKNVYGTEAYNKKVADYKAYIDSGFSIYPKLDEKSFTFGKYKVLQSIYSYSENNHMAEKSTLTVFENDKQIYTVSCLDIPMSPYIFQYGSRNYMVYRKTLFGYSLIDLDTLEEFNYFPEEGINGEAYIAVHAILFMDILIFDGCYWGCPYGYLFAQLGTDNTFYFSADFEKEKFFESSDSRQPIIKDDSVILFNSDGERRELFYPDIMKMF